MMLHRNLGKVIIATIICAAILYLIIPLDFMLKEKPQSLAIIPHEDPGAAESVFSGISSLMFDSDYRDFLFQANPEEVEARLLKKVPFVYLSQDLKEAINNFVSSSISISHLVVQIDEDLGKLRALVGQFRMDEALVLADNISATLSQANSELTRLEQATETTGVELKVPLALVGSDMRRSYAEVGGRINRIREMLDSYQNILTNLLLETKRMEFLKPTEVILNIEPVFAFVGDDIRFEGVLTSEQKPLVGREVDILLNGSRYITVRTNADGRYQGVLQVPYWYLTELGWQALYYPRDKDIGLYIASLSQILKVLFYEARLEITLEDKAYPGRETTVSGWLDYGQSPPLNERKVEIYLDDVFMTEFVAQEVFAQKIKIDAEADVGKHIITVSSAAAGRYAPIVASAIINVTRATPILDLTIPKIALIPGGVRLEGKLYSEVGPLSGALIKMGLDKSQIELTSSEDGAFDTKIKVGIGFGMIGWQDLAIQVIPQEPWRTPLNTTSRVLMVNMLNTGGFLAILVFLAIYLPARLRRRLGELPRRRARPMVGMAPPEPTPVSSDSASGSPLTEESERDSGEPRRRIFYWYRLVVRFLLRIVRVSLRPQQTLREFADEHSGALGPGARYFVELTRMVERVLYSQYRPTEQDVENSRQLSLRVEEESNTKKGTKEELKGEGV